MGAALGRWREARAELETATQTHGACSVPGATATPAEIEAWAQAHEAIRVNRAHLAWLAAEIDEPVIGADATWRLLYTTSARDHATVGLGAQAYARRDAQTTALELRAIGYRARAVTRGDTWAESNTFEVWLWTCEEGALIARSQTPRVPVDWREVKTVRIYRTPPLYDEHVIYKSENSS